MARQYLLSVVSVEGAIEEAMQHYTQVMETAKAGGSDVPLPPDHGDASPEEKQRERALFEAGAYAHTILTVRTRTRIVAVVYVYVSVSVASVCIHVCRVGM